jgi:hypothetical protein
MHPLAVAFQKRLGVGPVQPARQGADAEAVVAGVEVQHRAQFQPELHVEQPREDRERHVEPEAEVEVQPEGQQLCRLVAHEHAVDDVRIVKEGRAGRYTRRSS